jgi:hypothetical protein
MRFFLKKKVKMADPSSHDEDAQLGEIPDSVSSVDTGQPLRRTS